MSDMQQTINKIKGIKPALIDQYIRQALTRMNHKEREELLSAIREAYMGSREGTAVAHKFRRALTVVEQEVTPQGTPENSGPGVVGDEGFDRELTLILREVVGARQYPTASSVILEKHPDRLTSQVRSNGTPERALRLISRIREVLELLPALLPTPSLQGQGNILLVLKALGVIHHVIDSRPGRCSNFTFLREFFWTTELLIDLTGGPDKLSAPAWATPSVAQSLRDTRGYTERRLKMLLATRSSAFQNNPTVAYRQIIEDLEWAGLDRNDSAFKSRAETLLIEVCFSRLSPSESLNVLELLTDRLVQEMERESALAPKLRYLLIPPTSVMLHPLGNRLASLPWPSVGTGTDAIHEAYASWTPRILGRLVRYASPDELVHLFRLLFQVNPITSPLLHLSITTAYGGDVANLLSEYQDFLSQQDLRDLRNRGQDITNAPIVRQLVNQLTLSGRLSSEEILINSNEQTQFTYTSCYPMGERNLQPFYGEGWIEWLNIKDELETIDRRKHLLRQFISQLALELRTECYRTLKEGERHAVRSPLLERACVDTLRFWNVPEAELQSFAGVEIISTTGVRHPFYLGVDTADWLLDADPLLVYLQVLSMALLRDLLVPETLEIVSNVPAVTETPIRRCVRSEEQLVRPNRPPRRVSRRVFYVGDTHVERSVREFVFELYGYDPRQTQSNRALWVRTPRPTDQMSQAAWQKWEAYQRENPQLHHTLPPEVAEALTSENGRPIGWTFRKESKEFPHATLTALMRGGRQGRRIEIVEPSAVTQLHKLLAVDLG